MKDGGLSAKEAKAAGATPADMKAAGWSVKDMVRGAGFGVGALLSSGMYTASELRKAGVLTARELMDAGYSIDDVKKAGESGCFVAAIACCPRLQTTLLLPLLATTNRTNTFSCTRF